MTRLRIHVEPVGPVQAGLAEVGQLQRARHRSRPLLTGCGSFDHGLAMVEHQPGAVRLRCRDAGDAHRAAALARHALANLAPLRERLPGQPGDRIAIDGASVRIESAFPPYAVHRVLASAKALPSDAAADAFIADPVDFVEYDSADAVTAFHRGDLHATAPTSFEIARTCSDDPRFRPHEVDIFALLLVNPRRPDRRSIVQGRRVLRDRLAAEPELASSCAVLEADDAPPAPAGAASGAVAELCYADFWPNAIIARTLAGALAELGTTARPRPVGLGQLHSRTAAGTFDLVLVLVNGYAGPRLSVPLTLTRSALASGARDARLTAALSAALAGPEDGAAWHSLTAAALRAAPAIPLCRFHGGSLLDPALPDHPPAFSCVLPLEHYRGGCGA